MSKNIFLKPRLSEKAYGLSSNAVYVFLVPTSTNKHTVARAVKSQFDVEVEEVRIANISGKTRRRYDRNARRYISGQDASTKKAYVTLAKGQKLPIFDAIEEAESEAAKAEAKEAKKEKK